MLDSLRHPDATPVHDWDPARPIIARYAGHVADAAVRYASRLKERLENLEARNPGLSEAEREWEDFRELQRQLNGARKVEAELAKDPARQHPQIAEVARRNWVRISTHTVRMLTSDQGADHPLAQANEDPALVEKLRNALERAKNMPPGQNQVPAWQNLYAEEGHTLEAIRALTRDPGTVHRLRAAAEKAKGKRLIGAHLDQASSRSTRQFMQTLEDSTKGQEVDNDLSAVLQIVSTATGAGKLGVGTAWGVTRGAAHGLWHPCLVPGARAIRDAARGAEERTGWHAHEWHEGAEQRRAQAAQMRTTVEDVTIDLHATPTPPAPEPRPPARETSTEPPPQAAGPTPTPHAPAHTNGHDPTPGPHAPARANGHDPTPAPQAPAHTNGHDPTSTPTPAPAPEPVVAPAPHTPDPVEGQDPTPPRVDPAPPAPERDARTTPAPSTGADAEHAGPPAVDTAPDSGPTPAADSADAQPPVQASPAARIANGFHQAIRTLDPGLRARLTAGEQARRRQSEGTAARTFKPDWKALCGERSVASKALDSLGEQMGIHADTADDAPALKKALANDTPLPQPVDEFVTTLGHALNAGEQWNALPNTRKVELATRKLRHLNYIEQAHKVCLQCGQIATEVLEKPAMKAAAGKANRPLLELCHTFAGLEANEPGATPAHARPPLAVARRLMSRCEHLDDAQKKLLATRYPAVGEHNGTPPSPEHDLVPNLGNHAQAQWMAVTMLKMLSEVREVRRQARIDSGMHAEHAARSPRSADDRDEVTEQERMNEKAAAQQRADAKAAAFASPPKPPRQPTPSGPER